MRLLKSGALGFYVLAFTLTVYWQSSAFALKPNSLYMGVSYLSYGLSKYVTSQDHTKPLLGTTFYPLFLQYHFSIGSSTLLGPMLGYTIFPYRSVDGANTTSKWMLGFPIEFEGGKGDGFNYVVGPMLLQTDIKGDGGTKEVRNGTSTATFNTPGSTISARDVALDFGAGYSYKDFHFSLDMLIESLLDGNRRTYSLAFFMSYNLVE